MIDIFKSDHASKTQLRRRSRRDVSNPKESTMSRSQTSQTLFAQNRRGKGQSTAEPKGNIWSSLLDNVSTGKHLPEKHLIVLGNSLASCLLTLLNAI